jgi:hypothetical protein
MMSQRLLTMFFMGVVVVSCGERPEVFYRDARAAREDGAIDRGWIPDWLPASAHDIHERHDIASNQSLLAFSFDAADDPVLSPSCTQVQPDALGRVPFNASWWPNDVPPSPFVTPRHAYYRCQDGAFAAVSNTQLYRWRP